MPLIISLAPHRGERAGVRGLFQPINLHIAQRSLTAATKGYLTAEYADNTDRIPADIHQSLSPALPKLVKASPLIVLLL